MTDTQKFFIDVLKLMPSDISLYIQSPHEEVTEVLNEIGCTQENVYKVVSLNEESLAFLIASVLQGSIEEYIHCIQIKQENNLLFEGYDGLEYGVFSKEIVIPDDFKETHEANEMFLVSNEW